MFVSALLTGAVLLSVGTAQAATAAITATPALQPAFAPDVADYVTRCTSAPVALTVDAPAGTSVAVDGDGPRTGAFQRGIALADGQAFTFTVSGAETQIYHVRCLPGEFPAYTSERTGSPEALMYAVSPTLGLVAPPAGVSQLYSALFDNSGAPIWWYRSQAQPVDAQWLNNGLIAYNLAPGGIEMRTLSGQLVRAANTIGSPSDIHELRLLDDGDLLLPINRLLAHVDLSAIGGPVDGTIIDAVVQRIHPDGSLAWEWRASDHIPVSESQAHWRSPGTGANFPQPLDIYHLNSIEPHGDGMVMSFRHLDAVYEVDASGSGDVRWKLGGSTVPGESLTVLDDPFTDSTGSTIGQHDARILRDGTLTLHDNGSLFVDGAWTGRSPRGERFRLDMAARTATLVEQVSDARVTQSICCGSSRKLPGGDWVMGWGGTQTVTELTPTGTPVFTLRFAAPIFSYRANPILPGQLTREAVRAGMDAQHPRSVLSLGGASGDFGNMTVGSASPERTFTVTATGNSAAHVSAVQLLGMDAFGYELTGESCAGTDLDPGQSCEVRVRFRPSTTAAFGDVRLRVTSDAASGPNELWLGGTGVAPSPSQPRRPAGTLTVSGVRVRASGTVTLVAGAPGPGAVQADEHARRNGHSFKTVVAAQTTVHTASRRFVRIVLRLNRTGRRLARQRGGRLRVMLSPRFITPGRLVERAPVLTLRLHPRGLLARTR